MATTTTHTATFAAGCFGIVEKIFSTIPGVVSTAVGYAGGATDGPTYQDVTTGRTGHAEAVQVVYDPSMVRYEELLITFWEYHDPTTPNRQGPDVGSQYRSVIFYHDDAQRAAAERSKTLLEQAKVYAGRLVTEIVPAGRFWRAEESHQHYLVKNPGGYCSHHLQSPKVRQALRPLAADAPAR
ncbi:MAG: peptide-methionine (S)-S-oxide reductase [Omnitrophica WOR_2 bacterium RIFCSPHIGHO2_02_FULL_68_15]|nr:MAG: peptide-methionine (S)-S-oxide reductase [Omnitrophica WOR_2 bacterium RIFCSPHIGHO2_02_FULL_68_15]